MKIFSTILFFSISFSQTEIQTRLACDKCHSPGHWVPLSSEKEFHHIMTYFPLLGQHLNADCIQCHIGNSIEKRHQFSKVNSDCITCHLDIHDGSFGETCSSCHTEKSWNHVNKWSGHEFTNFPLIGAHNRIDCFICHKNPVADLISSECISCHASDFNSAMVSGKHPDNEFCDQCHNSRSFSPTDMGRHDILFFPINSGEHKGEWSSCVAECHINPSDYSDFSCGLNGVCHEHRKSEMDDEHDDEYGYSYESTACFSCHPNGDEHD
jgi:hypothetical protein